ncbi:MAG TPA: hypothetical protein V6C89_06965 [Drouetiella sp.]|jgi:hypothetical protein
MRSFLYKLYFMLTGPLYRRLHLELSLQMQDVVRANVEHNEKTTRQILDELLRLSYILNGGQSTIAGPDETRTMSDDQIASVIRDVDSSLGLIEVSSKHELPLNAVFRLRTRFSGMNASAIQRTREIETHCAELTEKVETLMLENKRLSSSLPVSLQKTP